MLKVKNALITLMSLLISLTKCYQFSNPSCSANDGVTQSPININPHQTAYFDEKYFRFLTNNYNFLTTNNTWTVFPEEKAIGIRPTQEQGNFGNFILVKDWAMHRFILEKILFRVKSEHRINTEEYDVEMQLVHSLDNKYFPPGRRVHLNQDKLVISVFFRITEDSNPATTQLFKFMNLEQYSLEGAANMQRDIKLNFIIQHQPSYLYEGTLTYPGCNKALWLLFANFHLISQTDYNNLFKAMQLARVADSLTGYNTRDLQTTTSVTVYRNFDDISLMSSRVTLMTYNKGSFIKFALLAKLVLLFLFA